MVYWHWIIPPLVTISITSIPRYDNVTLIPPRWEQKRTEGYVIVSNHPIQCEIKVCFIPWLTLDNDLFNVAEYMSPRWPRIFSVYCSHNPVLLLSFTCHRICKQCNTTDATSEAGTSYRSSTTYGDRVAKYYVSCVVFCGSLFVPFLLDIVLSVFWFMASDPFGS
jgi:hypothetical protein